MLQEQRRAGPGEHHGCPYKHQDKSSLRTDLMRKNVTGNDLNEVMRLAGEAHYQVELFPIFLL